MPSINERLREAENRLAAQKIEEERLAALRIHTAESERLQRYETLKDSPSYQEAIRAANSNEINEMLRYMWEIFADPEPFNLKDFLLQFVPNKSRTPTSSFAIGTEETYRDVIHPSITITKSVTLKKDYKLTRYSYPRDILFAISFIVESNSRPQIAVQTYWDEPGEYDSHATKYFSLSVDAVVSWMIEELAKKENGAFDEFFQFSAYRLKNARSS